MVVDKNWDTLCNKTDDQVLKITTGTCACDSVCDRRQDILPVQWFCLWSGTTVTRFATDTQAQVSS